MYTCKYVCVLITYTPIPSPYTYSGMHSILNMLEMFIVKYEQIKWLASAADKVYDFKLQETTQLIIICMSM